MRRRCEKGFTLMELMVVIVIVAILAAVAVPLYINYVKDAQRTEAKGAIGAIVSAEQVYFQQNRTYLNSASNTGEIESLLGLDLTESKVNWGFKIEANGDVEDGFQITADGSGGTKGTSSPANGLVVQYKHSRSLGSEWVDDPTPVEPPSQ